MVCFIHRPEYYLKSGEDAAGNDIRGKAEFIIAKHRSGAVGDVDMRFQGKYARFENWTSDLGGESGFARQASKFNDDGGLPGGDPLAAAGDVAAMGQTPAGTANENFLKSGAEETPF